MVPGMDLQSQYDQVKQNSIGKSQQETLRDLRRNQTTDPSTDWSNRGVSGYRGAGYQEVNPSQMPTMDDETRNLLSPVLGTYQEGGQNREGYYGSANPYTLEGALKYAHNAGFDPADQTLDSQVKQAGGKLPNIFGISLANNAAKVWGEDYGNYQNQIKQQQQQSSNPYSNFIPGQDYGDWKWHAGAGPQGILTEINGLGTPQSNNGWGTDSGGIDPSVFGNTQPTEQPTWLGGEGGPNSMSFADSYKQQVSPEGSGRWEHADVDGKKGSGEGYGVLDYRPEGSQMAGYDFHKPLETSFMGKYFPALMNAAAYAMPAVGALMTTARSGTSTGDWGQAIGQGVLGYAGGELAGAYGKELGGALGMSGELAKNVGSGLISTGVNAAGNAALGNGFDFGKTAAGLLGSIGGNYLGGLANSGVGGGTLGNAVGGGVKSLASGLASSAFGGDGFNLQDLATKTAIGAAAPTLGGIFGNNNEQRSDITNLAGNALNLANTAYKANKRK